MLREKRERREMQKQGKVYRPGGKEAAKPAAGAKGAAPAKGAAKPKK